MCSPRIPGVPQPGESPNRDVVRSGGADEKGRSGRRHQRLRPLPALGRDRDLGVVAVAVTVTVLTVSQLTCTSVVSLAFSQTTSLPGPQSIVSTWWSRASACRTSSPSPPFCVSVPRPGQMRSLPGPPSSVSSPGRPRRMSLPSPPLTVSLPSPPQTTVVAGVAVDACRCRPAVDAVVAVAGVDGVVAGAGDDEVRCRPVPVSVSSFVRALDHDDGVRHRGARDERAP